MSSINSIASLATQQSQATLKQNVGVAVAKKSLDAAKQQGQAAISLLDAAVTVQKEAAGAPAAHHRLDVRA